MGLSTHGFETLDGPGVANARCACGAWEITGCPSWGEAIDAYGKHRAGPLDDPDMVLGLVVRRSPGDNFKSMVWEPQPLTPEEWVQVESAAVRILEFQREHRPA